MAGISKKHSSSSSGDTVSYVSQESIAENGETNKEVKPPSDWSIVKPIHIHRLYYKILHQDISHTVIYWMDEYICNKYNATYQLLQLFVDLCSFQNFSVEKFAGSNSLDDIVEHIESWPNFLYTKYGRYILKLQSKRFLHFHKRVEEFMVSFIKASSDYYILYDYFMITNVTKLLKSMSQSQHRAIRHTGVFLSLKCLTGIVEVTKHVYGLGLKYKDKKKALADGSDDVSKVTVQIETLHDHYKYSNKVFHFLYEIFRNNWNLHDNALSMMRTECILEIQHWVKIYPERFFKNDALLIIVKAITEDHKTVRLAGMQVLMSIFDTNQYHNYVRADIKRYMVVVGERIFDKDINNAVYAVDLLCVIDKYYMTLSREIRRRVFVKIYCFSYPLAAASGRYLAHKIHQNSSSEIEALWKLVAYEIELQRSENIVGHLPLLVEAVIDYLPVLQHIEIYVHLFKHGELDEFEISVLVDILCETLHISTTGNCSLKREKCKKRPIDNRKLKTMIKTLQEELDTFATVCVTSKFKKIASYAYKYNVEHFMTTQGQNTIEN